MRNSTRKGRGRKRKLDNPGSRPAKRLRVATMAPKGGGASRPRPEPQMDQSPMYEGTVVGSTKDGKCYFLRVENHEDYFEKDVFLPGTVVTGERRQLPVSTKVRFQVKDGAKGPEAIWAEITFLGRVIIKSGR